MRNVRVGFCKNVACCLKKLDTCLILFGRVRIVHECPTRRENWRLFLLEVITASKRVAKPRSRYESQKCHRQKKYTYDYMECWLRVHWWGRGWKLHFLPMKRIFFGLHTFDTHILARNTHVQTRVPIRRPRRCLRWHLPWPFWHRIRPF